MPYVLYLGDDELSVLGAVQKQLLGNIREPDPGVGQRYGSTKYMLVIRLRYFSLHLFPSSLLFIFPLHFPLFSSFFIC